MKMTFPQLNYEAEPNIKKVAFGEEKVAFDTEKVALHKFFTQQ